ncbi:MAG TPA: radical SAM protein [Patescibacteria group bacterium]|nr:radical SAM protein [Patescibacteria group bacterium]
MRPRVLLFNLPPSGGDLFPISLGYIAASLSAHRVETALAEIDRITPGLGQSITNFILDFKPQLVGFSVYQANIRIALQLARLIKIIDPGITVVIGGPQVTHMPGQALRQMPAVDIMVTGEGETVMPKLVSCLCRRGSLEKVKGIVFRKRGSFFATAPAPLIRDLDDFASPYQTGAFNLADHKAATMLTSRGCCFNCGFCYTPRAFGYTVRAHSVRRVLEDMRICVDSGIKRFFFADPSFTYNRARSAQIMRGIIKKGWKVEIWCESRADQVDKELLKLMARAGVSHIAYGLESVDQAVHRAVNKPIDLRQFARAVTLTQDLGMRAEVFTLYGLPQQTVASCMQTLDFLKKLGVKIAGNSAGQQLLLFFGTDMTDDPEKYGIRLRNRRRPLYLSPGVDFETRYMNQRDIARVARRYKAQAASGGAKKEKGDCISLL